MILAREYRLNDDGTDSIIGILRGVRLTGPQYQVDVTLVVKYLPEPRDIGEEKTMRLVLRRERDQYVAQRWKVTLPTYSAGRLAGILLPMFAVTIECGFPEPGMYSFTVSVDDQEEQEVREWLNIIQEEDNGVKG